MSKGNKIQSLYERKFKSHYHVRASNTNNSNQWEDWKIRSQALVVYTCEQTVVILMLFIIVIVVYSKLIQYFTESSYAVMIEQNVDQSQILMYQYSSSSQHLLDRSSRHLLKASRLYEFIQRIDSLSIEQPYECLNNFTGAFKYQYDYTYCYGFFEAYEKINDDDKLALNYSSMLTEVLPMMDLDLDLLFSTVGSESYFSIWPGDPFIGYHPHKRVWYTGHLEEVQNNPYLDTVFSEPYVIWTWFEFMITQTKSMLYLNKSIAGVLGSDVNMSLVQAFSNNYTDVQASIISRKGMILLSQYDILNITYFNNTNVTGFNDQDFQQILRLVNGKSFQNNCTQTDNIFRERDVKLLCRYNQLLNQEEFILAQALNDKDMIIVLEFKATSKDHEISMQIQSINDELVGLFNTYIYIIVGVIVGQILLVLFCIYLIFRPLINLTRFTNQQIFKENQILSDSLKCRIKFSHVTKKDEFHNLLFAFKRMIKVIHKQQRYQMRVCACLSANCLPCKTDFSQEILQFYNTIKHDVFILKDESDQRVNIKFILKHV